MIPLYHHASPRSAILLSSDGVLAALPPKRPHISTSLAGGEVTSRVIWNTALEHWYCVMAIKLEVRIRLSASVGPSGLTTESKYPISSDEHHPSHRLCSNFSPGALFQCTTELRVTMQYLSHLHTSSSAVADKSARRSTSRQTAKF